jgi:hypothetical protein
MSASARSLNTEALSRDFENLQAYVRKAAEKGEAAHEVERGIWTRMLSIGRQAMGQFFTLQGSGDLGESVTTSNGRQLRRFEELHARGLRTIFGRFELRRAVYGVRETQKIELVPLDTRLGLPESEFSYVLQEWDQSVAVENSYSQTSLILERILGFDQPVDSLERMNREMAAHVPEYREFKPSPPKQEEGKILVVSADGKGIPMRREAGESPIFGHRKKGQKKNKKRMATVGAVYTIDPWVRTAAQVVESLFRDPKKERPVDELERPHPNHKQVMASLTHEKDGQEIHSADVVFGWAAKQAGLRNLSGSRPWVAIMDGQESLWEMRRKHLPGDPVVEILDLLHVTPKLWSAAHVFHTEGSDEATQFVKERLLRVLQGEVGYVIGGLRQRGTKAGLKGTKRKTLSQICNYLEKNRERLRYDEYLKAGYPIASGVIEGACRHLVKDRMERSGMRWSMSGAQAMLDLRSTYLNGDWDDFTKSRIKREAARLYPNSKFLKKVEWPMAA